MPSVQHQFLARVVPKVHRTTEADDPDTVRRERLAVQAKVDPSPPGRIVRGCDLRVLEGHGFPVHDLRVSGTEPSRAVLYLHGGGYVSGLDRLHWKYAVALAGRLDARVLLPDYPLAPEHTWWDSRTQLLSLFEQVAIESAHGVTVAGDSAGGGLALALVEQVALRAGPQPTHVVLISPWLDLTNATPGTAAAAIRDPQLKLSRLRLYANWWAGDDDPTRPELSPLYGDLSGLPRTLMFCGTLDLLHPQCRALADRALEQGWDLTYVEEPDLLHAYPLLPIPEATSALERTLDFLG